MITHQEIKPAAKGKSDFFSWQLYRWAKDKPHAMRIWAGTWSNVNGVDRERPILYIGWERDGYWIHARQLRNLCAYGANLDCYAYGPGHDTKNWVDVTDAFWADYFKKGVCAIHGDYAHDWNESGDLRTCNHCGAKEKKESRLITREIWVTE